MNLPASSSNFKPFEAQEQSANARPAVAARPPKRGQPRSAETRSKKDQDLPLKLLIAAALATNGYYARINVGLSATSARGLSDVTDIDVFGTRYDITFTPATIAASCKSGESKSLSPAREIFYLRGVLDYVRAGNGVAAFSRKPIPQHLRDLGRRLDVLVLSGSEVEAWCNRLINGMPNYGYFQESSYDEYISSWGRTQSHGLAEYLQTDYWFHLDFRNLQNVIVHLRKLAPQLTGQQRWHALVLLDTAAHFCLTIFDLCREIGLLGLPSISNTTAAYLFGGAPSFKARRDLYGRVQQLLSSTGVLSPTGPKLPPLEPSYTGRLSELAVRLIERPQAAVLIPQIIQDNFWRALGAAGATPHEDTNYLAAEKLTQDVLDFLKIAADLKWIPKI